jgi:serine/threonine-protein kinase RsbW
VTHELQLTLLLRSSHLAAARHEASRFLDASGVHHLCIEDVLVALTEATANAAVHSGVDVADVQLAVLADHIRLTVADTGRGFDANDIDLSRRPSLLSAGGRGLYLISCVMDSVHIDGTEGTTITMIKHLRPSD